MFFLFFYKKKCEFIGFLSFLEKKKDPGKYYNIFTFRQKKKNEIIGSRE